jgi:NADPH2:quinone reductase
VRDHVQAVTITDGKLVTTEHPDPVPGTGELLVRVAAAGVNGADALQAAGNYPAPPGSPPDIPGLEVAGTVAAVGAGVTRFQPGDRVMSIVGGGGQAELAITHERVALPCPPSLSWAEAGGFAEVFATAYDALFPQAGLRMGERVLIHGAAGGVGSAAVQLAAAAGCRVVASVRRPEHRDRVAQLAAAADSAAEVQVLAPDAAGEAGPFEVILELVGAPNFPANLHALEPWGRLVVIGVTAGTRIELDLRMVMVKRARILGSTLRNRPLEQKAVLSRQLETHVLPALAAGRLQVPVHQTYPLEDAQAAYEAFTAGGKLGKIVLVTEAAAA